MSIKMAVALCTGVALLGCTDTSTIAVPSAPPAAPSLSASPNDEGSVTGRGIVDLSSAAALPLSFEIKLHKKADGSVSGEFWQKRERNGLNVEFTGRVTCLTFDPVNNRAWIGGVILENRSTDPAFLVDTLHTPGLDIWFRVMDRGESNNAEPDLSSTLGFKWAAGFETSAAYCAGQPWPNTPTPNARTFPVVSENIQVHP